MKHERRGCCYAMYYVLNENIHNVLDVLLHIYCRCICVIDVLLDVSKYIKESDVSFIRCTKKSAVKR